MRTVFFFFAAVGVEACLKHNITNSNVAGDALHISAPHWQLRERMVDKGAAAQ